MKNSEIKGIVSPHGTSCKAASLKMQSKSTVETRRNLECFRMSVSQRCTRVYTLSVVPVLYTHCPKQDIFESKQRRC